MDTLGVVKKCPAGCTAIAAAQMLFYLHSTYGVPATSPNSGICTGYVYNNTVYQNFWNYTSNTWSNMYHPRNSQDTCAALLVGDVGKKVEMQYHWNGSLAPISTLGQKVFEPYGWNSIYTNYYDSDIIVSNLTSGNPVICLGFAENRSVGKNGHTFLIDGYKRFVTKTRFTYVWVPDVRGHILPPLDPPVDYFVYSSPHVSYYSMNWGQQDTTSNAVWCSLSGIWQYGTLPPYSYLRQMVHSFTIMQ